MKCPACWAETAYERSVTSWRERALICLLLVPMKCHHCFHKFAVARLLTIGKQLTPCADPSELENQEAPVHGRDLTLEAQSATRATTAKWRGRSAA
jgi:hypothetical protein